MRIIADKYRSRILKSLKGLARRPIATASRNPFIHNDLFGL